MNRTSFSYVLKEISQIFGIGLMVFMIILLMDKIFTDRVDYRRASLLPHPKAPDVHHPLFLGLTSRSLGTLLTLEDLRTMKLPSNLRGFNLLCPVLISAASLLPRLAYASRGNRGYAYYHCPDEAGRFRNAPTTVWGFVVYVEGSDEGKKWKEFDYDEREGEVNTIWPGKGSVNDQTAIVLNSSKEITAEQKTNTYQKVRFDTYDLKLELSKTIAAIGRKLKEHEMSIDEIKARILKIRQEGKNPIPLQVELHKRYALPFACVVFGLIGVPLGIQPRRSGRSHGFVFSILILLGYYISLSACEMLALRGVIPPFMAGWAPTFVRGYRGFSWSRQPTTPFKPWFG
jgi:lipopolysaccharide export system permease protein